MVKTDLLPSRILSPTYIDVLNADTQYHQAKIADLQATAVRYQDTVALFAALGGGWRARTLLVAVADAPQAPVLVPVAASATASSRRAAERIGVRHEQ
jgi:ABC-type transport system involved in cytochrome c biogenesis permease component